VLKCPINLITNPNPSLVTPTRDIFSTDEHDNAVRIVRFQYLAGVGVFLFITISMPILMLTQPPVQWLLEALFPRIMCLECEYGHSSPSTGKVDLICNLSNDTFTS
jgi:hypothetical protein